MVIITLYTSDGVVEQEVDETIEELNLCCMKINRVEGLEKLVNLKELNLAYNNISDLTGLEKLVELKGLRIVGNNIRELPDFLVNLKNIEIFWYYNNPIENVLDKVREWLKGSIGN